MTKKRRNGGVSLSSLRSTQLQSFKILTEVLNGLSIIVVSPT